MVLRELISQVQLIWWTRTARSTMVQFLLLLTTADAIAIFVRLLNGTPIYLPGSGQISRLSDMVLVPDSEKRRLCREYDRCLHVHSRLWPFHLQ